ncbi:serine/threonine-protein kinase meng-po-like isoform X1 [Homarus americanus]|nr:serine/threonine-protein kinase meng-po-like isoform X1 [Homarus americanus]XP_042231501.1 serine/threonine-protein kinase meng-po-like isoform X1 [Homarus americanus]
MVGGSATVNFHNIKMLELPRMEVDCHFSDVRLLAENSGAKVYGARYLQSGTSVVLKCVQKEATKKKDFCRERHYNHCLSSHPNIVKCFDDTFETSTSYVLTQELTRVSDLSKFIMKGGVGEMRAKLVAEQVGQALEFMHKNDLVHRDVCSENIFVFSCELTRFKLGDFGSTQRVGAFVKKQKVRSPWAPPEVSLTVYNEGYLVDTAQDAWQLGILIFVCLTGSYPWSSADITDHHYNSWVAWLKRKTTKMPPRFKCFTPRLLRLLRRLLEPKPEKRSGVRELYKYLSDPWLMDESNSFGITINAKLSQILSGSSKSLYSRAEEKLLDLVHSRLHHSDVRPPAGNKKRVRFSFDGEIWSPGDAVTPA